MKNIIIETEVSIDLDELVYNFSSLELINHTINSFNIKINLISAKKFQIMNSIKFNEKMIEKRMWYIDHGSVDENSVAEVAKLRNEIVEMQDKLNLLKYEFQDWSAQLLQLENIKYFLTNNS